MTEYNYKITTADDEFKCEYIDVRTGEVHARNVWYDRDDEYLQTQNIEHIEPLGSLVPQSEIKGFARALADGTDETAREKRKAAKDILRDEMQCLLNTVNS